MEIHLGLAYSIKIWQKVLEWATFLTQPVCEIVWVMRACKVLFD